MKTENKDRNIEKDIIDQQEQQPEIQGKVEDHSSDLETLIQEKNEINDKYMRLAAEFSNYKRRTENEKKEIYSYANEKIVYDLLNVLDNFERAIASMEQGDKDNLIDGVQLIFKQFSEVLESHGLSEIKSHQCEFDPNFHHAVMKENAEGIDSNMIIQVLQKGYSLNGKVVRPSMVKVAE